MKTAEEILCEVYGCMDKEELSRFFSIHEKSSQMILEAMEIYASQKHIPTELEVRQYIELQADLHFEKNTSNHSIWKGGAICMAKWFNDKLNNQ